MESKEKQKLEAERLKAEGNECFRRKLFNKSVHFYTLALELDPDNSVLWANRAQAYLNLHKPEKAYMDACGALKREPNSCKALFRRALALNKLGLKAKARDDAQRCAKLEPQNKGVRELIESLGKTNDSSSIDLTVFQRPEALQSKRALAKKHLISGSDDM